MIRTAARALTHTFLWGLVVGMLISAYIIGQHWQEERQTAPAAVTTSTWGNAHHLPPFWHQAAPSWCYEDMPCWIGTNGDGRTDKASFADWTRQLHRLQDK